MAGRWAFALAVITLGLAGCGKDAPVAAGPQGTYDQHCAQCHAQAGEKGGPGVGMSRGPKMSDIHNRPGRTKEWLAAYIRDPKSVSPDARLMPAFGDKLTDAQIQELAEWIEAKR